MLVQLVESVAHCHALGIVHRDLKPENVMQAVGSASDQPLLKLCDFGQAAMISGGEGRRLRRKCGTEQYMAPEVLDAELGGALGCERTQPPHSPLGTAVSVACGSIVNLVQLAALMLSLSSERVLDHASCC